MYFDDSYFGSPLPGSPAGHVPWQGVSIFTCMVASALLTLSQNPLLQTTVNPVDVLLTQPSRGPTNPDAIPHNVVASYGSVGYPGVGDIPQEALQYYPPVWLSQPMSHVSVVIDFACRVYLTPYDSL